MGLIRNGPTKTITTCRNMIDFAFLLIFSSFLSQRIRGCPWNAGARQDGTLEMTTLTTGWGSDQEDMAGRIIT